jgi:drug/metabolite transporter (DMT)-like permease
MLGLLGIGMYNALQYMALQSSTPINVTLVASGMPVWMMLTGWLFFGVPVSRRQVAGAVLSIAGVLLVLARGEWRHVLELRLVAGDLFMILATIAWSLYSWLLLRPRSRRRSAPTGPACWRRWRLAPCGRAALRWASRRWARSGAVELDAGGGAAVRGDVPGHHRLRLLGRGRARGGAVGGRVLVNLTPLFTAVLSSAFLGEAPHGYHAAAFALIVGGIVVSASRR